MPCLTQITRTSTMDKQLYLITLRLLARCTEGEALDPMEVAKIRSQALPEELDRPLDEVCCRIIHGVLRGDVALGKSL